MPKLLLAGCGFLGLTTARLFHKAGWEVLAVTHSTDSAAALAKEPFPVAAADISDAAAVKGLGSGFEAVVHCASSGKGGVEAYRKVFFDGMRNLLTFAPARFLFVSSTSVYAQTDGIVVTEESPAEPRPETGLILRGTEELVLAKNGIAARLAGLYGPGRSVMLKKFFYGEATIEGDGTRWINQVHRDDAADAIFRLITTSEQGVFNVADDRPIQQRALYQWLATRYQRPLPPTGEADPNRKRGLTNKRVSNARLKMTGWQPRFPSFFQAVENDPRLMQAL
ncbi:MAG TPA: NAD-dependent epimerase/dehydratase family protein [Chthoniobacteraceae bacterium]|jgi:nucleoside-diphosphate-sugar epimerase